jgi:hypothetical protein
MIEEVGWSSACRRWPYICYPVKLTIDAGMVRSYDSFIWIVSVQLGPNPVSKVGAKHFIESEARRGDKFYG